MSRLNESLVSILVCPETGRALRQEGAELVSGEGADQTRYPIENDIPLLLPLSLRDAARHGA